MVGSWEADNELVVKPYRLLAISPAKTEQLHTAVDSLLVDGDRRGAVQPIVRLHERHCHRLRGPGAIPTARAHGITGPTLRRGDDC